MSQTTTLSELSGVHYPIGGAKVKIDYTSPFSDENRTIQIGLFYAQVLSRLSEARDIKNMGLDVDTQTAIMGQLKQLGLVRQIGDPFTSTTFQTTKAAENARYLVEPLKQEPTDPLQEQYRDGLRTGKMAGKRPCREYTALVDSYEILAGRMAGKRPTRVSAESRIEGLHSYDKVLADILQENAREEVFA
jgi:hypothetical protein